MSRQLLLFLTLFLCIGVTERELPECMSLGDDVANDGDVAVYNLQPAVGIHSLTGAHEGPASPDICNGTVTSNLPASRVSPASARARVTGVGLLRLIEQQRC
jgi:hypothetical protein